MALCPLRSTTWKQEATLDRLKFSKCLPTELPAKVVLGGDATEAVWDSVHRRYGKNLKCHVLKASHHGRDSGCHKAAVEAMPPEYVIVSVGKKPETDASNKYRQYCANVWSTRWTGAPLPTISVSMAFSTVFLLVLWLLRVTPDWVKLAAEAYALRLLAACDQLSQAVPSSASPKLIVNN